jgi:diadenosine tetraphosphate (Ap4A) HIT family hydrolase
VVEERTVNETIEKFGYPENVLKEYDHWVVLIRPKQVTAGCMVLACKETAGGMSEVSSEAFAELPVVTGELEVALKRAFAMEKINYILLMMVDKEVHFHVIPRYSEERQFSDCAFTDPGWPRHPDMKNAIPLNDEQFSALRQHLMDCW